MQPQGGELNKNVKHVELQTQKVTSTKGEVKIVQGTHTHTHRHTFSQARVYIWNGIVQLAVNSCGAKKQTMWKPKRKGQRKSHLLWPVGVGWEKRQAKKDLHSVWSPLQQFSAITEAHRCLAAGSRAGQRQRWQDDGIKCTQFSVIPFWPCTAQQEQWK